MDRIGFVGLGAMGRPMARNLLRATGAQMIVHDLNPEAVAALVAEGARAASSLAELAAEADLVITMLPDSPDVEAVVLGPGGILDSAPAELLVMDMSTIAPAATDRIAAALAERGHGFVDAPVGRTVTFAELGRSLFMVGASSNDFGRVKPVLEGMGDVIHHCGAPGAGIRTKLVNNYLAIVSNQVNAEALALAQSFGLDLAQTLAVVNGTTATNGHLTTNYVSKVFSGDIAPGFRIALADKDLTLALQAAQAAGMPMFAGRAVREAYALARVEGWADKDFSAMVDAGCTRLGLPVPRLPG